MLTTSGNVAVRPLLNLSLTTLWVASAGGELDMPQLVVVCRPCTVDILCTPIKQFPLYI